MIFQKKRHFNDFICVKNTLLTKKQIFSQKKTDILKVINDCFRK